MSIDGDKVQESTCCPIAPPLDFESQAALQVGHSQQIPPLFGMTWRLMRPPRQSLASSGAGFLHPEVSRVPNPHELCGSVDRTLVLTVRKRGGLQIEQLALVPLDVCGYEPSFL